MSKELIVKKTISIEAAASKVWETLTKPELTRQYMFGCAVLSDWEIGSPVIWKGEMEGKEIIFVKGHVRAIEAGKMLEITVFDPNMGLADVPENYLWLRYELSAKDGNTILSVVQGDYSVVENGAKRYEDTVNGWDQTLVSLKDVAEKLS